ncbi:MAG: hypothetical protein K8L99_30710, partial [Anaerolineae bacterium]|nr:hypothetical protein [Anaerolineae bacterium]
MRRKLYFVLGLLLAAFVGGSAWAAQVNNPQDFAFDLRADLELLANEVLGLEQRPAGWTFNTDQTTATFISDLWFDNELLANEIFGETTRPADWFGANNSSVE